MRHALYGPDAAAASVAILVKEAAFDSDRIKKAYINGLNANPAGFIAYSLWYDDDNKCPADLAKDYLKNVLHSIKNLGIKQILIADGKYFKFLTKEPKAASNFIGYSLPSKIEDYEDEFTVFYVPNYQAAKYNPRTSQDMDVALNYFKNFLTGNYIEPGKDVIHSEQYPSTLKAIKAKLEWLLTQPALTVDIETKGLKFWNCGIATITFAWDKHNFISIPVDRGSFAIDITEVFQLTFPDYVKALLKNFFKKYTGKLIGQNLNFDFKILTYELWMEHLQDYRGMIQGIEILTRNFDDTKIITYLATNNAIENVLKLKVLAADFLGNYGEDDITDTTKIPLPDLLRYNGKDGLATWYVYEKYWPKMVADNQLTIYNELFKPSVITLLETELVGMPIYPDAVALAKATLTYLSEAYNDVLSNSKLITEFLLDLKAQKCKEFTATAKKKVFDMADPRIERIVFNPNSPQQVGNLLFDYLKLPILDLTDTNLPATGIKTLKKLLNHTTNQDYLDILNALIDLSQVEKILSSFIPAFENNSVQMPDGTWRLYGNFNLGGTVSGRLSCVAGWTPILTSQGTKPIANIHIGDKVWTHDERWEPVTNTIYKGVDHMVNITLCSGEVFTCTTDHKVLLSSGDWTTIKEILNVNFEDLGGESTQYQQNNSPVQIHQTHVDHGTDCTPTGYNASQHIACTENPHDQGRIKSNQSGQILSIQNWNQESNERQDRRSASQLEGRMFGLQGVLDHPVQWETGICTSSHHDAASKINRVTRNHRCTSHRQRSIKQRIRQSCVDYQRRAQAYPLLAGRGQSGIEIKKIEYFGCTDVYDITVANSSSYLSCGFYSHNSSDPNLQNLPSHSVWAKLIKECFGCTGNWLFGGADFNSLEDMVSALTTRDPNKMKVYLDGYDGHCLRAYSYFEKQMPDITDTVQSINSIKNLYPHLRQRSKNPTFALTYQGTWHTLVNTLGLDKDEAMVIETNYHELYKVSDEWVAERLQQACVNGYVTGAFGLRLRTPLLKMNGKGKLHYKAAAEGRTAGNMLGQSYGMLNSRAANEMRERIWASPYRYDILPCGQIHDACYFIWRNTVSITKWVNDNLIACMEWDGLVELQHPTVKIGAELDIFYPDWSNATTLKNGMSKQAILTLCTPQPEPK